MSGRFAEGHEDTRTNCAHLFFQKPTTRCHFIRLWVAIARRPALEYVCDVHVLAAPAHRCDHLVKQLPRAPHERLSQPVFISTNGGDNLWIGNNENATGKYIPPPGIPQSPAKELANDKATRTEGKNYILDNPGKVISLWPAKLEATFLTRSDVAYWSFQTEKGKLITPGMGSDKPLYKFTQRFSANFAYWLLIFAGVGAVLSFPFLESRRALGIPVAMIGLTALLSMVFFGNPRFGFPAIPFQAMLAASAVGSIFMLMSLPLAWWQEKKSPPGRLE